MATRALFWFRNDLRLRDNTSLAAICEQADQWLAVFVRDPRIELAPEAPRQRFLFECLHRLAGELRARGHRLVVRTGRPERVIPQLAREVSAELVGFNADTTHYSRLRDARVRLRLERAGVRVVSQTDRVVFDATEVRTAAGGPFSVYSPYRNAWLKRWAIDPRPPRRIPRLPAPLLRVATERLPSAVRRAGFATGGEDAGRRRLARFLEHSIGRYHQDRDRPDIDGTSRLSPHLRFGTVSVRDCFWRAEQVATADAGRRDGAVKWMEELIWREFYAALLQEHPQLRRKCFRETYERIRWNDDADAFRAWSEGRTGYPIVDAGIRQLLATGWMHNRVRMIVASFLTKDLLIDWRRGEQFFFDHLIDGDPASNAGGWQWSASTGADAQPYFRIFNPVTQGLRCDPSGRYVQRWVPELRAVPAQLVHTPWKLADPPAAYPSPIVDHAERRAIALERYRNARTGG